MIKNLNKNFSVLILAAGNSGRMGSLKAFLPFDDTQCFLEKIITEYQSFGVSSVFVVLNEKGIALFKGLKKWKKDIAILNPFPEKERFFSIKTGLEKIPEDHAVFIHNVDNPFLKTTTLNTLIKTYKPGNTIIPIFKNRGGHPILISPQIIKTIRKEKSNKVILKEVINRFPTIRVPVSDNTVLININTEEEYRKYFL